LQFSELDRDPGSDLFVDGRARFRDADQIVE